MNRLFSIHSASGRGRSCRLAAMMVSLSLAVCAGCSKSGPEIATVDGVVTLDGQPLPEAMVMFKPDKGRPSLGRTNATGAYTLAYNIDDVGARIGNHRVSISTYQQADGYLVKKTIPERVPAKYNRSSTLTREVVPGSNTMNFDLQSK